MRRTLFVVSVVLLSITVFAQSNSPEALYDRGMDAISGAGLSRNDLQALDYFRQSAEMGYGPAEVVMGYFYETGTITTSNHNQAIEWYRKAAEHGSTLAQWMLGRRYYLGGGIPQDPITAQKWLQPAADHGNPFAAYYLGRIMDDRDYTKAPALFKVAADQGITAAQYFYAKALNDGRGIAMDRLTAYAWFVVALDGGYYAARTDLSDLDSGGNFTQAQIADAKGKARELEQSVIRAVNSRGCAGWEGELGEFPTPPPPKIQPFCK